MPDTISVLWKTWYFEDRIVTAESTMDLRFLEFPAGIREQIYGAVLSTKEHAPRDLERLSCVQHHITSFRHILEASMQPAQDTSLSALMSRRHTSSTWTSSMPITPSGN